MAYQGIGTGTTPNDNTGDSLLIGAVKVNSNFQEIYNALGDGSTINFNQTTTITAGDGLTGGGDLTANRTFNVGAGDGIIVAADSVAVNSTVVRTSGDQTIGGTLTATTFVGKGTIPIGGIIMWSGSVASIPTGWALCNGSNGTPDLRNRFVVAAGNTYSVGATGGSADAIVVTHDHGAGTLSGSLSGSTDIDGSHTHSVFTYDFDAEITGITGLESSGSLDDNRLTTLNNALSTHNGHTHNLSGVSVNISGSTGSQGVSGTNANLPPYYALAYIMRIS